MAGKQVQRRRGSTAEHAVFTGAVGEITVDTDKKTAVVHDGVTAGGNPLARFSDIVDVGGDADAAMAAAVAAQSTADTGVANAATADAKAVVADGKATTAQGEVDALETVVATNATLAVPRDSATGAAHIPIGNNAQRPVAPVEGDFRFNSQLTRFEGYQNGQWAQVGGDSLPVFFTTWWPNRAAVPAGFVVADGQLLNRATYPDAAAGIAAGNVPLAADADWLGIPTQRGKYTVGNGTTTFRMPDYNGKFTGSSGALFLRGDGLNSAGTNGVIQTDALQNIVGTVDVTGSTPTNPTGVFAIGAAGAAVRVSGSNPANKLNFDASLTARTATETRPLNVTGCWVVKLFGAVINPGAVDAAQLASDMANLSAQAYQRSNILGAVSQAAGVPTGALLEYISNANGEAWKFASGQMIAIRTASYASIVVSTAFGSMYGSSGSLPALNYAATFVSVPVVVTDVRGTNSTLWHSLSVPPTASAGPTIYLISPTTVTGSIAQYQIAVGRWF